MGQFLRLCILQRHFHRRAAEGLVVIATINALGLNIWLPQTYYIQFPLAILLHVSNLLTNPLSQFTEKMCKIPKNGKVVSFFRNHSKLSFVLAEKCTGTIDNL